MGGIWVKAMSDFTGELARGFVIALTKSKASKGAVEIRPVCRERQAQPKQEPETKDEAAALPPDIHAKAELAARRGTTTFRGWWKSDEAKAHRATPMRSLEHYQGLPAAADEKDAPTEESPVQQRRS